MSPRGAEILLTALQQEDVEVVFGYPGGKVVWIYDALYNSSIHHVLTRHEQAAIHAADGYARASGRVGVCLATSGPGATNLVTGLATAYMDSVPVIALTGQVPTAQLGCDAFQEADILGITLPVVKHSYLVKDLADLPRVIHEAFYIASTGRPGPVLVDLPQDITGMVGEVVKPKELRLPGYKPVSEGNEQQMREAVAALLLAERPVLYAGGGAVISGAQRELKELAERLEIPVTTTLMGLTAFPSSHPLSLGMLGMHGTATANYAVTDCDLLVAAGARFDDRVTGKADQFAPNAKVIHIDVDAAEIGKNVPVDIPIVGDLRRVLSAILEGLPARDHRGWMERIATWKDRYPLCYKTGEETIAPQQVIQTIASIIDDKATITTEVGQHQMWAAHYLRFSRPRSFLTSGGLGTMGFGLPAAIGAQIAMGDGLVVAIAGDGSLQMNIQELATVAERRLPVKIVVMNNGVLGMVRQWQKLFCQERYAWTSLDSNPDFVKLAEAYGIRGLRVEKPQRLKEVLEDAFQTPGPVLLDCVVSREQDVYPMVPQNSPIHEMLGVE